MISENKVHALLSFKLYGNDPDVLVRGPIVGDAKSHGLLERNGKLKPEYKALLDDLVHSAQGGTSFDEAIRTACSEFTAPKATISQLYNELKNP